MRIEIKKITDKEKLSIFRFVAAGKAKITTRYSIEYIYVQSDYIVSTDGRRLHAVYFETNIEPGYYEVVRNNLSNFLMFKVEPSSTFPKWQDIIPEHKDFFTVVQNSYFVNYIIGSLAKKNIAINIDYLKPLEELDIPWDIYFAKEQPIKFVSNIKKYKIIATIMPININYKDIVYKKLK